MGTHIGRATLNRFPPVPASGRSEPALPRVVDRIRAEFQEMPGMRLTGEQVARLCGVDRSRCAEALERLVAIRYLELAEDGSYSRPSDVRMSRGFARGKQVKS
ncbi:MAG TPA: hypothetical protein VFV95_15180 [Vicinamibacterales bacterium]|nr:hypothetical protein [Vicinamibacterales bacterium]